MIKLQFYTTLGCHLCEQAEVELEKFVTQQLVNIEFIDIIDDDNLMERYGTRIPVLKRIDNQIEIGWPFDEEVLTYFLG